jgi:hypothetical protein
MIRQDWNALEVGDHVFVHRDSDQELPPIPGRVVDVEVVDGSNVIAISISPVRGKPIVVHPRRLAVHLEELDPDRRCWRCESHARSLTG